MKGAATHTKKNQKRGREVLLEHPLLAGRRFNKLSGRTKTQSVAQASCAHRLAAGE